MGSLADAAGWDLVLRSLADAAGWDLADRSF